MILAVKRSSVGITNLLWLGIKLQQLPEIQKHKIIWLVCMRKDVEDCKVILWQQSGFKKLQKVVYRQHSLIFLIFMKRAEASRATPAWR